jgi:hypothetical protein
MQLILYGNDKLWVSLQNCLSLIVFERKTEELKEEKKIVEDIIEKIAINV